MDRIMERRAMTSRGESMKHVPALKDFVKPLGPYSHAVVANGFVFISAQTGLVPRTQPPAFAGPKVEDQTRQALRNVDAMNDAYKEFFPSEPPSRSVARLGAEVPGLLVSIDAVAVYSPRPPA